MASFDSSLFDLSTFGVGIGSIFDSGKFDSGVFGGYVVNELFSYISSIKSGSVVVENFIHETGLGKAIKLDFTYETSVGKTIKLGFTHELKLINVVNSSFQHSLMIHQFADPVGSPALYSLSQLYNLNPIDVGIKIGASPLTIDFSIVDSATGVITDLGQQPYQFSVSMQESQATTWSLSIIDPFGSTNPLNASNSGSSPWYNLMSEQSWGADRIAADSIGVTKLLVVNATWGGQDWHFSGVPQSFSHTRNWGDKFFAFAWKGTDHSIKVNREHQSMKTLRSTSVGTGGIGTTYMASSVIGEILTKYFATAFTAGRSTFSLNNLISEDYVIPVMQRQNGNPLDWVTQILGVRMHEWRMENGDNFISYYPNPNANPSFIHDFSQMNILEESYDGSAQAIITKVIVIRAVEGGGGQSQPVTVSTFKDGYTCSFSPPISQGYYNVIYAAGGFFSNFIWKKGGQPVAYREMTSGSIGGIGSSATIVASTSSGQILDCDEVSFTWGALPGSPPSLSAPGKISFRGIPSIDNPSWGGSQMASIGSQLPTASDPAPWARVFSPDPVNSIGFPGGLPGRSIPAQVKYGIRVIEITANPLIPTSRVAQLYADRYIMRVGRQARHATYKIPLNPWIVPGSVLLEIDKSLQIGWTPGSDPNMNAPYGSTAGGTQQWPTVGPNAARRRIVTSCTHNFSSDPANRFTTVTGTDYMNL